MGEIKQTQNTNQPRRESALHVVDVRKGDHGQGRGQAKAAPGQHEEERSIYKCDHGVREGRAMAWSRGRTVIQRRAGGGLRRKRQLIGSDRLELP